MSGSSHLPDVGAELQAIIAAKISLREEIKTELRAEFNSLVNGVSNTSDARYTAVNREVDAWRHEVERQTQERVARFNQRFEAVAASIAQVAASVELRREIIETRIVAMDRAKDLLTEELDKRQKITDAMLNDLRVAQNAADQVVDSRAQAANDALERLLVASISANTSIGNERHSATQTAISKVERQVAEAIEAVDKKSFMRCETSEQNIKSVEEKLHGQLLSLKELFDLQNDLGKEAITKAENASERRFEGLNELRGAMSDQSATFLPRSEAEARFNSNADKLEQVAQQVSTNQLDMKGMMRREDLKPVTDDITKLRDHVAITGGKEKVWAVVGSGGLAVCAIIVALFAAFHSPSTSGVSDASRINDLIQQFTASNASLDARLSALSNRINQLTPPLTPAPPSK